MLKTFKHDLTDSLLEFLWKQWCQLGVPGSVSGQPENRLIDLEALLAFTTELGRHDIRLFDEATNWVRENGHWINIQRLTTILTRDDTGDHAVAGALAAWMSSRDQRIKWGRLAARGLSFAKNPPVMLFHSQQQSASAGAADHPDEVFFRYGLIKRGDPATRHPAPVAMIVPPNFLIKCRSIFGLGVRADVIAYLLVHGSGHARQIASFLGYNHMGVQDILHDLHAGGAFPCHAAGRTKKYVAPDNTWWNTIMGQTPRPAWPDWRLIFKNFSRLYRAVHALDESRADDYITASTLSQTLEEIRPGLMQAGLHLPGAMTPDELQSNQGTPILQALRAFMRLQGGCTGTPP